MNITNVKVRKIFEEGPMKAVVSVTFDDCLAVHDVKVVSVQDKTFVIMPSVKLHDGSFRDVVHPINSELRNNLTEKVLEEYEIQKAISEAVK